MHLRDFFILFVFFTKGNRSNCTTKLSAKIKSIYGLTSAFKLFLNFLNDVSKEKQNNIEKMDKYLLYLD
mgnify:CR=1 FL=1